MKNLAKKKTNLQNQVKNLTNRINEEQFLAQKRTKNKHIDLQNKLEELNSELNRKNVMNKGLLKSKQLLIEEKAHILDSLESTAQELENFKLRSQKRYAKLDKNWRQKFDQKISEMAENSNL